METARIAGWVFSVNCNWSAGPLKQTSESAKPRASSAASKTCLAAGNFSARSFPMPASCEPWPGNRNAIADCRLPIANFCFFLSLIKPKATTAAKNQSAIGNRKSEMLSPTHHDAAPGHAAAEACHQDYVALGNSSRRDALIKADRNRCGRSVAVHRNVRIHLRAVDF